MFAFEDPWSERPPPLGLCIRLLVFKSFHGDARRETAPTKRDQAEWCLFRVVELSAIWPAQPKLVYIELVTTSPRSVLLIGSFTLCVTMFGCSHDNAKTTTWRDAAADATTDAADEDATPGVAVCTPGSDQTCNDSLSVSALHGRCLPERTCSCMPPFTKNIASGKCAPAGHPNCKAFCQARQINIQQCKVRNGDRNLRETYQDCIAHSHVDLCPTDPSCGGWLRGCLDDAQESLVSDFPSTFTCAQSVAAGLFRP